jgi:hypothetical protein
MNLTGSLLRKIAYLAALVVLAIPIVWLGSPSTQNESGGKLAQLRHGGSPWPGRHWSH